MSTTSRGNYYKVKTKKLFEKLGYVTQITEFMCGRPVSRDKLIYVKKDVFGSDGISMNGEEIIFWNSKHCSTNDKHNVNVQIRKARKEFGSFPFPEHVKRQIIMWYPRRKKPDIIECI